MSSSVCTSPHFTAFQICGVPPSTACSQYAFRFAAGVLPKLLRWPRTPKMKRSSLASLRSARQSAKAAIFLAKNGKAQVVEFAKSPGPSTPMGKETKRPTPYTTVHPPPHTLFIFPSCRSCSYLTGRPPPLPNREPKRPENRPRSRGHSVFREIWTLHLPLLYVSIDCLPHPFSSLEDTS